MPNATFAMNHERVISFKARVSCSFTSLKCTILRNRIALPNNAKYHPSLKHVVRTATHISDRKILQRPFLTSRDSRRVRIRSSASSDEYNQMMNRQMKNPYEYHHELGMYYHKILDTLYVGSQPQTPDDITRLANEEGVTAVLNLQQDSDISYWGIDLQPILARCHELGVAHYRRPARDFDPNSLRYELPKIVSVIDRCISEGSKVYVHCTAGLGRAPGAAISYLYWFRDMDTSLHAMMTTGLKMRLGCQITDGMLWVYFIPWSEVSSKAVYGLGRVYKNIPTRFSEVKYGHDTTMIGDAYCAHLT